MRIILAIDGSGPSQWAAEYLCRALPGIAKHGKVSVVHVDSPFPVRAARVMGREIVDELHQRATSGALGPSRRGLDRHRIPHQPVGLVGNAGGELAHYARETRADLIVMGARGLGMLKSFVLGSTTQRVLGECAVPVIVIRSRPSSRVAPRVLIAVDGSASSTRASRHS
jgi:nucleotide-binding universal stress UspA family protein